MRRGTRHVFVFVVFFFLLCVGAANILFATSWFLPDYFFSEWDPYDHLFERPISSVSSRDDTMAAAPLLADYVDDIRFQYSARTFAGALWQDQDITMRTWRRWLRGPWRAAAVDTAPAPARSQDANGDGSALADVPYCPWPIKKTKKQDTAPVRFFTPMSSSQQLIAEQGVLFWFTEDAMAQLQLRYVALPDEEERAHVHLQAIRAARAGAAGVHPALLRGQESSAPQGGVSAGATVTPRAVRAEMDTQEEEARARDNGEPRWISPSSREHTSHASFPLSHQTLDYADVVRAVDVNKTWSRDVRYFDLPRQRAVRPPQHPWTHFYIALNLYHNEALLPFLTAALTAWLEDEVAPFFDLAHSVVVTIYANKADRLDQTGTLIHKLLIPELHRVGVRVVFATTAGRCLGMANKMSGVERIEWMACVRNKAMQPLYAEGMRLFDPNFAPHSRTTERTDDGSDEGVDADGDGESSSHTSGLPNTDGLVVLFLNDIYFQPRDLTRLLESKVEPGMRHVSVASDGVVRTDEHRVEEANVDVNATPSSVASASAPATEGRDDRASATSSTPAAWPGFDLACGMDFYFSFYDTWVSRDRLGHTFRSTMPYTNDGPTQDAFERIFAAASDPRQDDETIQDARRLAVPVKCCWNGAAAIRGSFFFPAQPHTDDAKADDATSDANSGKMERLREDGNSLRGESARGPTGRRFEEVPLSDQSDYITWLSAYFLRLQLRRISSDRVKWAEACTKAATRAKAPAAPVDLSVRQFFEDDVPTLLAASDTCARVSGHDQHTLVGAASLGDGDDGKSDAPQTRAAMEALCIHSPSSQAPRAPTGHSTPVAGFKPRGTLLRAAQPAVRFRHAFVPSYGAMHTAYQAMSHAVPPINGTSCLTAPMQAPPRVVDNVCLSSECQLICHDVQHAAILRHHRLPVILMNPSVRFVYDAGDLDRVIRSGWYESVFLYRLMRRVVRADRRLGEGLPRPWQPGPPRWWRLFSPTLWLSPVTSPSAAEPKHTARPSPRQYSPKVHMRTVMDATDDWVRHQDTMRSAGGEAASELMVLHPPPPSAYAGVTPHRERAPSPSAARVSAVMVNVTQLTRMDCLDDVLTDAVDPPLLLHALTRIGVLAVVAVLLVLLCRWADADARAANGFALVVAPVARREEHGRHDQDSDAAYAPFLVPTPNSSWINVDARWWLHARRFTHSVRLCVHRQWIARWRHPMRRRTLATEGADDGGAKSSHGRGGGGGSPELSLSSIAVRIQSPTSTTGTECDPRLPFSSVVPRFPTRVRGAGAGEMGARATESGTVASPTVNPFVDRQTYNRR